MKIRFKYILLIASVIGIFPSCKKESKTAYYAGYDYFPNKLGHYVIYEVDSIVHSPFGNYNYRYQVKELIDSIYNNAQGQPTMRIARYYRPANSNLSWNSIFTPQKIWTGNLLPTVAKRQEDNYIYAKLIFPMTLNETWNGNAYNTLGTQNYQYTSLHVPNNLTNSTGTVHFDSTLTVLQQKDSTLLSYHYYFEEYATGIGLIHKVVNYDSSSVFGPNIIPDTSLSTTSGVWYSETYLSSGNQ
jgi:hypothetical protein